MQNREKGNFHIVLCVPIGMNFGLTFLNYSHKDPVLKELFLDKRFRIALSISINRDGIGLKWDKNHGYRLRPDGKRLKFVVKVYRGIWL